MPENYGLFTRKWQQLPSQSLRAAPTQGGLGHLKGSRDMRHTPMSLLRGEDSPW